MRECCAIVHFMCSSSWVISGRSSFFSFSFLVDGSLCCFPFTFLSRSFHSFAVAISDKLVVSSETNRVMHSMCIVKYKFGFVFIIYFWLCVNLCRNLLTVFSLSSSSSSATVLFQRPYSIHIFFVRCVQCVSMSERGSCPNFRFLAFNLLFHILLTLTTRTHPIYQMPESHCAAALSTCCCHSFRRLTTIWCFDLLDALTYLPQTITLVPLYSIELKSSSNPSSSSHASAPRLPSHFQFVTSQSPSQINDCFDDFIDLFFLSRFKSSPIFFHLLPPSPNSIHSAEHPLWLFLSWTP